MIAALCAGFAAVCFFALGWLFSSWFNEKREKREKTITTSQIPITKSQLSPADLVAIRYLMPYLNSALLERTKKKNNSLADLSENHTLANCLGRLEKLIDRPVPIIHDYR